MKHNKLFLSIILLLFIPITLAYVSIDTYNGIQLKFYNQSTNKQLYYQILDNIPEKYFEDLYLIKIVPHKNDDTICGRYFPLQHTIVVYQDCTGHTQRYIIEHELAHHNDPRNLIFLNNSEAHDHTFDKIYEVINMDSTDLHNASLQAEREVETLKKLKELKQQAKQEQTTLN